MRPPLCPSRRDLNSQFSLELLLIGLGRAPPSWLRLYLPGGEGTWISRFCSSTCGPVLLALPPPPASQPPILCIRPSFPVPLLFLQQPLGTSIRAPLYPLVFLSRHSFLYLSLGSHSLIVTTTSVTGSHHCLSILSGGIQSAPAPQSTLLPGL